MSPLYASAVRRGLAALGKRHLVFAIHDASFPSEEGEDLGRGSPYARGGRTLLELVRALGFTGVQLGPQGQTSASNPSPYDGALFSRSFLSVDVAALVARGWVSEASLTRAVDGRPSGASGKAAYVYAYHAMDGLLREAEAAFERECERDGALRARLEELRREQGAWLARDARFYARARIFETDDFARWPTGDPSPEVLEREERAHAFRQMLAHEDHARLRRVFEGQGLAFFGDLQVGPSIADRWSLSELFLRGYAMGAPPSRTNPEGQPWGYPVLDPAQRTTRDGGRGPVLEHFAARVRKMLAEYDGIRLDHPHGLVTPWVYREEDPDPYRAVQGGARLHCSPDVAEHPRLAAFAIARPEQIDRTRARYADEWVRDLDPAQVEAYGAFFRLIVEAMDANRRDRANLVCEVLSTMPYPLQRVVESHGLGRFRVTQKASVDRTDDVYRSENARPADWIMVGNHDTPPLALVVDGWTRDGTLGARARTLAEHLANGDAREALAGDLARDRAAFTRAMHADLFVSPAGNVSVFFSDLFGLDVIYNRPGVVDDANWSARVPRDVVGAYCSAVAEGRGLDVAGAIATALEARGGDPALVEELRGVTRALLERRGEALP